MTDKDGNLIYEAYDRDMHMRKAALRRAGIGRGDGEVTQERGNPYEDKQNLPAGTGKKLDEDDGYKERGQRREGMSMLANVEKFLASEGDASSVAAVHKAIQTMYMHVADIVEGMEDHEDKHFDGIDSEPSRSRETDQDRYGYAGDR